MLILSRKAGESITIGPEITVTVTRISKSNIRLGIEAPRNVSVSRLEQTVPCNVTPPHLKKGPL